MSPKVIRRVLPKLGDWSQMRADFRFDIPEFFNIAERCCDSWAMAQPDRVAVIDLHHEGRRETWTYAQLKQTSDGLAASFRARGVGPGDRVAVLLPQSPAVLIAHLAAYKLGAVILPLFTLFGPDALDYRLRDSGAKVIVTDGASLEKVVALARDLPNLQEIYAVYGAISPVRDVWAEIATPHSFAPVQTRAEDPACLIYTSGTTGDPKGVLHAHRFLIGHLPSIETQYEGFALPDAVGWTPADWAWIGGLMDMALPCLYYGVPLIAHRMRKFDPERAWALMRDEAVTASFLPPTALKMMRQVGAGQGDLSLRAVFSGGESLGAELLGWGHDVLGAPINEGYGQTECNLILGSSHGLMPVKPGSMGKPEPGFEVAVIDSKGTPAACGEIGEVAVKRGHPVMFLRYWNKPEKTSEKFVGDWLRTGDMGRCDADGYYWFLGRDDDVITTAGYRVGPTEIENCLISDPQVVNAAVIGVPDPERTEIIKACIVADAGVDWDALVPRLRAMVADRVSPHLAPRLFERHDTLPMTATGKVMRRALRGNS